MINRSLCTLFSCLSLTALIACSGDDPDDVVCGNGVREKQEQCDDGNTTAGDGCSAVCTTEVGGAVCGNGTVEGAEQCDDGNTTGGDGCSAGCTTEGMANCGNGQVDAGEQCDDGNTTGGDGCSATCQTEGMASCGNGTVEAGEQCDDGNTTGGDGCSATCQTEGMAGCGNGQVEAGETCDDGNTISGDGCSATCQTENMATCGNGQVEAGEQCDDGNTTPGDGCSATCQTEMMTATCQEACDYLFTCTEMMCPGTVDVMACVAQCTPDPVMFQTDLIVSLTCPDINMQVCPPPPQETDAGNACVADMDCNAGVLQQACIQPIDQMTMEPTGWEGGYCTAFGCQADAQCGMGKVCLLIDQASNTTACFQGCDPATNGMANCRMPGPGSYQCLNLDPGMTDLSVCAPACAVDMDCAPGTCNVMTGQCM